MNSFLNYYIGKILNIIPMNSNMIKLTAEINFSIYLAQECCRNKNLNVELPYLMLHYTIVQLNWQ